MGENLAIILASKALLWLALQQSRDQAFRFLANSFWETQLRLFDVIVKLGNVVGVIWRLSHQKLVHYATNTVEICLFADSFLIEHFR